MTSWHECSFSLINSYSFHFIAPTSFPLQFLLFFRVISSSSHQFYSFFYPFLLIVFSSLFFQKPVEESVDEYHKKLLLCCVKLLTQQVVNLTRVAFHSWYSISGFLKVSRKGEICLKQPFLAHFVIHPFLGFFVHLLIQCDFSLQSLGQKLCVSLTRINISTRLTPKNSIPRTASTCASSY